jgi:hypothetical protein
MNTVIYYGVRSESIPVTRERGPRAPNQTPLSAQRRERGTQGRRQPDPPRPRRRPPHPRGRGRPRADRLQALAGARGGPRQSDTQNVGAGRRGVGHGLLGSDADAGAAAIRKVMNSAGRASGCRALLGERGLSMIGPPVERAVSTSGSLPVECEFARSRGAGNNAPGGHHDSASYPNNVAFLRGTNAHTRTFSIVRTRRKASSTGLRSLARALLESSHRVLPTSSRTFFMPRRLVSRCDRKSFWLQWSSLLSQALRSEA